MIDGNVKSLQDICSREILRFGECTSSRYKFDELYIEELPLPRLFKSSLSDWIKTWYNVESELDYSDDSDIYTDGSGWDEADGSDDDSDESGSDEGGESGSDDNEANESG